MPTPRIASVFADPPVYTAARSARPYAIPGAAIHDGYARRELSLKTPALFFLGGATVGILVAVAIIRGVTR